MDQTRAAMRMLVKVLKQNPGNAQAVQSLVDLLMELPVKEDPAEIVGFTEKICSALIDQLPEILDALAAAAAKRGRYAEAMEAEQRALEKAQAAGRTEDAARYAQRLKAYEARQ
jgi:hypothetical protein